MSQNAKNVIKNWRCSFNTKFYAEDTLFVLNVTKKSKKFLPNRIILSKNNQL